MTSPVQCSAVTALNESNLSHSSARDVSLPKSAEYGRKRLVVMHVREVTSQGNEVFDSTKHRIRMMSGKILHSTVGLMVNQNEWPEPLDSRRL